MVFFEVKYSYWSLVHINELQNLANTYVNVAKRRERESLTKKRTGQGDKSETVGSSRRRWISTRSRRKDMTHTEPPLPTSTTSLSYL